MLRVNVPYGLMCCYLRGEGSQVDGGEPSLPAFFFEHLLNHERIDIDEADL